MSAASRVKVGIIGSGFEADIHAESFRIMPDEAEVVAVASPTPGNAAKLAQRYEIPRVFTDYRPCSPSPTSKWRRSPCPTACTPR
ncbi:MAG: Gfo/Idh/MocA family oxidoreductase [Isosphaeraceae bacterium]